MLKSELKTGMIVTNNKNEEYMVFTNCGCGYSDSEDVLVGDVRGGRSWNKLSYYNDDLTYHSNCGCENDIVKVEEASHPYGFMDLSYKVDERKLLWKKPDDRDIQETIDKLNDINAKISSCKSRLGFLDKEISDCIKELSVK